MPRPAADLESADWRSKFRDKILKELSVYLERVYRKSQSQNSVKSRTGAILNLCAWQRKMPSEIVKSINDGKDPYQMLDDFAGHLSKLKLSSFAIKNSVSGARRFLVYSGIRINPDEFKDKVSLPRVRARTHDESLTPEKVRRIFVYCVNPVGKRLVAFLTSTGCRVMEALPTKYSDIDFKADPPRIYLPENRTKDRIPRYVWLTPEVVSLIKEGNLSGDDYLFPSASNGRGRWKGHGYMSYSNANYILKVALKRAGLYREDEYGRALLTLHSFRKYTYTQLSSAVSKADAQAIVGHSEYLDQSYWRKSVDEMGKIFAQGQNAVTIMAPQPIMNEKDVQEIVNATLAALIDREGGDETLKAAGIDPEIIKGVREELASQTKSNGPTQVKQFGTDGKGNVYDVRVVKNSDKAGRLALLKQGFERAEEDWGPDQSVYRRLKVPPS